MRRGEVHWGSVLRQHSVGHEQHNVSGEPRPWLILSDPGTQRAGPVLACPLTKTVRDGGPGAEFHVAITPEMIVQAPGDVGAPWQGTILVEQLRAMSMERFRGSRGVSTRHGKLRTEVLADVERVLFQILALPA